MKIKTQKILQTLGIHKDKKKKRKNKKKSVYSILLRRTTVNNGHFHFYRGIDRFTSINNGHRHALIKDSNGNITFNIVNEHIHKTEIIDNEKVV